MTKSASENAILARWRQTLGARGEEAAVRAPDGTVLRSFQAIEQEAEKFGRAFSHLPQKSVIAVQMGNSASWPALVIALFRRELIPLPLGRHVETAELELALATCHAAAIVTCEAGEVRIQSRKVDPVSWSEPAPDFLKLTSGTTSAPRAVRFRAEQLLADCDNICSTMGIGEDDVNFGVIPFSHSYGFSNLITPLLCCGVPLVASEDRLPRAILLDLVRSRATVFPGMPVFFQKIADLPDAPQLPGLRLCISAGALLGADVAERFSAKFGLRIHSFYGASESGGIAYDREAERYKEGFVGAPMNGIEIDHSGGSEPAPIVVRGSAIGDGYFPDPEPQALGEGRFVPSDLIRWSGQGMFLAGRVSDVINIAGRKLNPVEIEQRIAACAGVKQVVVFGVPSPLRGEEPVACVVTLPGVDEATVLRFCRASLSQWQCPKEIWGVSEIPVTERGKISRRALCAAYLARASEAAGL